MLQDVLRSIDLIYEAALVPSKWMSVLDQLARSINAEGTLLFCARDGAGRSLVSDGIVELVRDFNSEGWPSRNLRAERLLSSSQNGFVSDFDLFTEDEMKHQPMYSQFLRPKGFGLGAATAIRATNGDDLVFSIEKRFSNGPVDEGAIRYLNLLRPHLARAALLANRLEFERVKAAVDAMQLTGLASAVLADNGSVLMSNELLESLSPQLIAGANRHLKFKSEAANMRYRVALANRKDIETASVSFAIPQHGDLAPSVVHMIPICGNARDVFSRAAFFLILTPIDRDRVPADEIIKGLFDLSTAEARVGSLLAIGLDVKSVAQRLSVAQDTVRSHVKAILSKSGMRRQSDFVAAVASIRHIQEATSAITIQR